MTSLSAFLQTTSVNVLHQGWLHKKGVAGLVNVNYILCVCPDRQIQLLNIKKIMKQSWKHRYFELVEDQLDAQLIYYVDSTKKEMKGRINMSEILEIKDVKTYLPTCSALDYALLFFKGSS